MRTPSARLAWLVVAVALAAGVYAGIRVKRNLVDLAVYRTAGARVLDRAPLYRAEDGHYQFKYLPAFALFVVPVALLPEETARAGWFALTAVLLVIFVRQALAALPDRRTAVGRLSWLVALVLGRFYLQELALGQTNVLLGVVLLAGFIAAREGRPTLAGALVGTAVFIKPYAVVVLPWLVLAWGAAALWAAGTVVVAGLALPAAVYGWSGNLAEVAGWFTTVTGTTAPNLSFPENISLLAMWTRWTGPGAAASALTAASFVALAAVALDVWRRRGRVDAPAYLEFSLLLAAVPLISPQGWDYVLVLATPAVLLVLDRFPTMTAAWRGLTGAALCVIGLTIFDLWGRLAYERLMSWSVVTLATLVLVAALAMLRRLGRA